MLKTVALTPISRDGLGWGNADWNYDSKGNIQTIQSTEAVVQNVVKCIQTDLQPWGYGTIVASLVGMKNIDAAKAAVAYSVKRGLAFLAWVRDRHHSSLQTMDDRERLKKELRVSCRVDVSSIIVDCQIETMDGETPTISTKVTGITT